MRVQNSVSLRNFSIPRIILNFLQITFFVCLDEVTGPFYLIYKLECISLYTDIALEVLVK